MSQSLILKRSSVAGKLPIVADLLLGEVAMNTYDGKLFLRKNNGADSIVEVGATALSGDITGSGNAAIVTALSTTGVAAGSYGSAVNNPTFTVDAKGRLIAASSVPATPSWSNVTGKPTTLAGYGITDGNKGFLSLQAGSVPVLTGTSVIPFDSSPPMAAEGTLIGSITVNPLSAASQFVIDFNGMVDSANNGRLITFVIWRSVNGAAPTLAGFTTTGIQSSNQPQPLTLKIVDAPNTTLPVTYTLRIGISSNGTWYLGRGATSTMGNVGKSAYLIAEL